MRFGPSAGFWARCVSLMLALAAFVYFAVWLVTTLGLFDRSPPTEFAQQQPAVGEPAPDFTLRDADGEEFHLHDHLGSQFIVIEFGSFT